MEVWLMQSTVCHASWHQCCPTLHELKSNRSIFLSCNSSVQMPIVTINYEGTQNHLNNTQRRLFSQLPFQSVVASAEEKESLMPKQDSQLLIKAQRASTVLFCFTASAAIVIFTVLIGLSYLQVTRTIASVDSSVGLRETAVTLLTNVGILLNNTASLSSEARSIATDAHDKMAPAVSQLLNNIVRLSANPTISLGGLSVG